MRIATMIAACGVLTIAVPAMAGSTLVELDGSLSYDWRSGSAVNSSGFGDEIEEYGSGSISARAAHLFDSGVVLQGELRHEESFADTFTTAVIPGIFESDETYRNGSQIALQLGQHAQDFYFGAFGAVGQVNFKPVDDDQDSSFNTAGVQLGWYGENWSIAGVFGRLDTQADNPESIDNASLVGLSAAYYVSDRTRLGLSVSKLSGDQDTDSGSGPDPLEIVMAGFEVEHQLRDASTYDLAVYGGIDWIDVQEQSSGGGVDRASDTVISVGVRLRFGGATGATIERQRTPALPDMLRAIGAVPIVD